MIVDDIVIVGGGSAGWMAASILKKDFPEKNITVVESPNIPTIGVGESTYDGINYYLEYLEIDRDDFFKYTDASIKLGIEFKNFYENDGSSFLYPFGWADVEGTLWGMQDWMIKKYKNPSIPVTDFAESYFPAAHLINHNSFTENNSQELPLFIPKVNTAFHFDAIKFANWLKERYCLPRGVFYISDEVLSVDVENKKVVGLKMESGNYITADLFIDCTGFKSLLLGGALEEPFIDYTDMLPNNSAWAAQLNYDDKNIELTAVTKCTALNNGWAWNTPLYSRLGAGYVYSNKFIDKDSALEEFKKYLCSDLMDFPKSKKSIDNINFRHIDMRIGIHERVWVNNVVAIGLSAAFIEPLESNGLFTIHEFLFYLVRALSRNKVTSWDIHIFNQSARDSYNSFAEFIQLHYALSIRDDTEYWKNIASIDYSGVIENKQKMFISWINEIYSMKTKTFIPDHGGGISTGISCISTGMNFFILDKVSSRQGEIRHAGDYSTILKKYFDNLENKKIYWERVAKESPKLPEYLKNKYYFDEA